MAIYDALNFVGLRNSRQTTKSLDMTLSPDQPNTTITFNQQISINVPNLRVYGKPPNGTLIDCALQASPVRVGSDAKCDLVLDDPKVSGHHCEIRFQSDGIVITDLKSKNGIYAGPIRIQSAYMALHTMIALGHSYLWVATAGEPHVLPILAKTSFGQMIGKSPWMRNVLERLSQASQHTHPLFIFGHAGTGKSLAAESIHQHSQRRSGPLKIVHCKDITYGTNAQAIDAMFFGTQFAGHNNKNHQPIIEDIEAVSIFEEADGGTLVFEDIEALPLSIQEKLVGYLQSLILPYARGRKKASLDVRVIATSRTDPKKLKALGHIDSKLHDFFTKCELPLPPLRTRQEDIFPLIEHFVGRPLQASELSENMRRLLLSHSYPENVRELEWLTGRFFTIGEFNTNGLNGVLQGSRPPSADKDVERCKGMRLSEATEIIVIDFQKRFILERLSEYGGHVESAAESLGISRQYLYDLMKKYRIPRRKSDSE